LANVSKESQISNRPNAISLELDGMPSNTDRVQRWCHSRIFIRGRRDHFMTGCNQTTEQRETEIEKARGESRQ